MNPIMMMVIRSVVMKMKSNIALKVTDDDIDYDDDNDRILF